MPASITTTNELLPQANEYLPITTFDIYLLLIFITLWFIAYYYTVLHPSHGKPDGFGNSTFISNLHSVPLCILAFLSLYNNTNINSNSNKQGLLLLLPISESIPLCYSIAYFIMDFLDSLRRKEYMWLIHSMISLVLNIATGWNARHAVLRSVSKGFFAEASTVSLLLFVCALYRPIHQWGIYLLKCMISHTSLFNTLVIHHRIYIAQPFLNYWKKSKSYPSFLTFFISFTVCRMIWVPYFIYNTYIIQLHGDIDILIWPSVLFYVLQAVWYIKMCGMVVNYKEGGDKKKKKGKKEQ